MKFFKDYWPLLIIFLFGLVPLVWFRQGLIIAGGDNSTYLDPSASLYNYSYAWFDKVDAGMPSLERPKVFPFSSFWYVGKNIGFSLVNIQRLWVVLHFMLPGFFMYLLILRLYKSSGKNSAVAGLIGATLYMFNYLVMVDAFQVVLRPTLTFLPLMLYFWIKGLAEKRFSFKYPSVIALVSLLYGSANINIAGVLPIYLVLGAYLVYFLTTTRQIKRGLVFCLISVFLFSLVNLWWLTNFYFSSIKISKEVIGVVRSYDFLKATAVSEAFRTMGFWAFLQQFNGKPLLPFALSYYRFPLIFITFLIPIFAFASLFFRTKIKEKIFFVFLALLGIFLAKGTNFPFGFFYQFLYDRIPGFSVYREPFAKFTLIHVFAFSVLVSFFAQDSYNFLADKEKWRFFRRLLPFGIILTILIAFFPLLTGKHIQNKDWYKDTRYSLYVKIPDYWFKLGDWFKKNNSKVKIMLFPKTYYGQRYNWELGISSGDPVALHFLPNPLIRNPDFAVSGENRLAQLVYRVLYLGERANLFPYFDLFAVDFVLQQNDISPNFEAGTFDPSVMSQILDNQKSLKPEITFGWFNDKLAFSEKMEKTTGNIEALKVYSVSRNFPSKQIYLPKEVVYVFGKLESFPDIFSFFQYEGCESYYFSEDQDVVGDQLSRIASKILIDLKNKRETGKTNEDFLYKFTVPRNANYKLLINEYLFESISKNGGKKEYYLKLNNKSFTPSATVGGWRLVDLGSLNEGVQTMQTNLPVNEIKDDFLTSPFWLVEDEVIGKSPPSFLKEKILSFDKINPSKYRVKVKGGNDPFILVLSETYNQEWKIYFNNKIVNAEHFLINGYANGWYLQPSLFGAEKDYVLELRYRPQKFTDIGTVISIVTISLLLSYTMFIVLKEATGKRKN